MLLSLDIFFSYFTIFQVGLRPSAAGDHWSGQTRSVIGQHLLEGKWAHPDRTCKNKAIRTELLVSCGRCSKLTEEQALRNHSTHPAYLPMNDHDNSQFESPHPFTNCFTSICFIPSLQVFMYTDKILSQQGCSHEYMLDSIENKGRVWPQAYNAGCD